MAAHTHAEKAQQKYVKLSREADKLQEDVEKASKGSQVKELEKLRAKAKKARQVAESADAAYKVSCRFHLSFEIELPAADLALCQLAIKGLN